MTNQELAAKLRCISTVHTDDPGCESCPFWIKEPVPEELRDDFQEDFLCQCNCDRVGLEAADALENSESHVAALQKEIEGLRAQSEKLQAIATELQSRSQWVSVTERLPEPNKNVLVIAHGWSDRIIYIGQLRPVKSEKSWLTGIESKASEWAIGRFSYLREPKVTHWMLLPEPPKEEE